MRNHGIGHAPGTDQRGQRASVDAGQPNDAARFQPLIEMARGAVVGGIGDGRAQDHAACAGRCRHVHRLDVFLVGADIADVREGEGDDLPGIGGIGQNLLIAGHRGVEADFANGLSLGAEPKTFQHRTIGQHKERGRLVVRPGGSVFRCGHERST
jgi:hypothetical protein